MTIKGKLEILSDGTHVFYCKGCGMYHGVKISENGWSFNNDYEHPTFKPSILVKTGHYILGNEDSCWCRYHEEHPEEPAHFKCVICHSFVIDGKIHYLNDCTHEFAGKIIDMEDPKS